MKKILIVLGILLSITIVATIIIVKNNDETNTSTDNNDIETSDLSQKQTRKASPEDYGKFVNYSIDLNNDKDNTNDWKLFYSDENNIFLISSGYILGDSVYLDLEKAGMNKVHKFTSSFLYESYIHNVNWRNLDEEIDTFKNNGMEDINESIANQYLLKTYYNKYPTSTNNNAKATASLLNTDAWEGLVDDMFTESAIGSPTLEMWVASWNEKGYTPLYCNNCTEEGYCIGLTDNPQSTRLEDIAGLENSGYTDTLYFPYKESYEGCSGYFLASPSASEYDLSSDLKGISPRGIIGNCEYDSSHYGIRPVVALKSNVTIQNENNQGILQLICN